MVNNLEKILGFGNDKFAYYPIDRTIRFRTNNIILGLDKDFKIDCLCGEYKKVVDKNGWVVNTKEYITYFGGMSEEEQNNLLPVVAKGLVAQLLRVVWQGRKGNWIITNADDICKAYTKEQEGREPFDEEELIEHFDSIKKGWIDDKQQLSGIISSALIDCIGSVIENYCGGKSNKIKQNKKQEKGKQGAKPKGDESWLFGSDEEQRKTIDLLKRLAGKRNGIDLVLLLRAAIEKDIIRDYPPLSIAMSVFNVKEGTYKDNRAKLSMGKKVDNFSNDHQRKINKYMKRFEK